MTEQDYTQFALVGARLELQKILQAFPQLLTEVSPPPASPPPVEAVAQEPLETPRLHWTQTPSGRKRMSQVAHDRHKHGGFIHKRAQRTR